jgi:peptide/nickel transport system ATP-binding protein
MDRLLEIEDLSVAFPAGPALQGVSLQVHGGQTVAVVGESGSGKTLTARSILRVLPKEAQITGGAIRLEGLDLAALADTDPRLARIRGGRVGMIYQEPMTALSEFYTIGNQIEETLIQHGSTRPEARGRTLEMLRAVEMPQPETRRDAFSFELSGGQRQRAMIAMALSTEPKLLIADEPTTALDVTTQAVILKLLKRLQAEQGMAMLFITHDMSVVANVADQVVVMHQGAVVEAGPAAQVLEAPQHPYTQALIAAVPSGRAGQFRKQPSTRKGTGPILRVERLSQHFKRSRGLFRAPHVIKAVDDVSLELNEGETLAVVGESGSGKTTLGRAVLGLTAPIAGRVVHQRSDRPLWQDVRMVFQDPMSSLNPRMTVFDCVADPLRRAGVRAPATRVLDLLDRVGLNPDHASRYPHAFSGGQRQRIGIARALAPDPKVIVLDEPVSALDVSVQARVLRLLADLQDAFGIAYLFISHDLDVVASVADHVAVMHQGRIVETGPAQAIFDAPQHSYTRKLLSARLSLTPPNSKDLAR